MKYLMRWTERSYGSAGDYEGAQSRVLEIMQHWKPPESVTIHQFVVSVGRFDGYAILETGDLAAVHQLTSTFAVFNFTVEPVMDVGEAMAAEAAAVAWRNSLP